MRSNKEPVVIPDTGCRIKQLLPVVVSNHLRIHFKIFRKEIYKGLPVVLIGIPRYTFRVIRLH